MIDTPPRGGFPSTKVEEYPRFWRASLSGIITGDHTSGRVRESPSCEIRPRMQTSICERRFIVEELLCPPVRGELRRKTIALRGECTSRLAAVAKNTNFLLHGRLMRIAARKVPNAFPGAVALSPRSAHRPSHGLRTSFGSTRGQGTHGRPAYRTSGKLFVRSAMFLKIDFPRALSSPIVSRVLIFQQLARTAQTQLAELWKSASTQPYLQRAEN